MPRKKRGNDISEDSRRHIARVIAHYNTPGLIKAERKRRGWTQQILATEMGLSVRHIVSLEKGQKPVSQMLCLAFHGLFTVRFPHRETTPMAYDTPVTDLSLLFDAVRKLMKIQDPNTVARTPATVPFEALACVMTHLDIYCKERSLHPSQLLDHLTERSKALPPSPRGLNDWQRFSLSPTVEGALFDQDAADFLGEIDPEMVKNSVEDDIKKFEWWMSSCNPSGDLVDGDLGIMQNAEAGARWSMRRHAQHLQAIVEYRKASNYPPAAFEDIVPSLVERLRPYYEGHDLDTILQTYATWAQEQLDARKDGKEISLFTPSMTREEFERRQQPGYVPEPEPESKKPDEPEEPDERHSWVETREDEE